MYDSNYIVDTSNTAVDQNTTHNEYDVKFFTFIQEHSMLFQSENSRN